ncbi:putative TetR-family transcriptional regulator [Actinomycetes bacterium]|nr:putative TetR-family transcriptional regulator [Actinomycetes bacterium]
MSSAKTDGLRRQVLDAAVAIAASSGPDAISMREVARLAGVSHQAPYHHFGDRAGIFAAISEEGFRMLAESIEASTKLGTAAMCEAYVHFALAHNGHFRVMMRNDLCSLEDYPSALIQADRAFNALRNEVTAILGEDSHEDEANAHTAYMWSVAHGLATLLLDGPLLKKLDSVADVNELIRNVARKASSTIVHS